VSEAPAAAQSVAAALADLRAEVAELDRLVADRTEAELAAATPFYGWRAQDVLAHLTFIDSLALLAATDPAACAAAVAAMGEGTRAPEKDHDQDARFGRLLAYELSQLGPADGHVRLARWREGFTRLAAALEGEDGALPLQWFGRPMKLATLISARQMEVWGYGQDVFDLYRARRAEGDRLRNVADFAVKTFRFAFANRGLPAAPAPYVALTAPSGAVWTWNDPAAAERITGPAVDFCLVCTQRRNLADTALAAQGETAATWMRIAQCIAGPPVDGPAPGVRSWA